MRPKIYLATPYSHRKASVQEARFYMACHLAGRLVREGYLVFSPIAHSHPICISCHLPSGFDYWERLDTEFLLWADIMLIAELEGWQLSEGIKKESELATNIGKPIVHWELGTEVPSDRIRKAFYNDDFGRETT